MPQFSRYNALDQFLDIAGSASQTSSKTLTDETGGLGQAVGGQTGAAANITTVSSGVATVTGLTGMTANSVGRFLTISGAASAGNNGTFLIVTYNSATSVDVANSAAVASDANNGSISWTERDPYTLQDDLNFERTDRAAIKGVAYDAAIPTYTRPTATGTSVPANLSNIAGKTTDAVAYNVTRAFFGATVAATNTKITITSAGNLKHANTTDNTGVPCFDAAPFTSDFTSCYVHITNPATGAQLQVQAGLHAGEFIFGVTNAGSSTSPNSVEVVFYSCPQGQDPSVSATAYTWEAALGVTSINLGYGYNERLDQLDKNAFRTIPSLGLVVDADLRQDINDIQTVIGMTDGDLYLTGLTNTVANYSFFNLPDGTPSVTEALNTLNAQIGDRTYTGTVLTSGQTIAASLQALSNAITNTSVTRYIERLAAQLPANTAHTLPGGASYVIDGTFNGRHLWVFTRGVLRDPGSVANGDDYAETSTTSITFFSKVNANDHINYFVH